MPSHDDFKAIGLLLIFRLQSLPAYACWKMSSHPPHWICKTYKTRFGIETSYRQMNQGRIRTCTRRPDFRLLFVAIALLLRNAWVWLHWHLLAKQQRGGRRLRLHLLRFRTMLAWLQSLAEKLLGVDDAVEAQFLA